ncbi:MAG TPA: PIN domain-containing protein [Dokdonella sp.]|uniref:PIN domain-containing protein n=1 Tax=Dokdonella sp. TaxID=2291710 RepID=UPI0025C6C43A|nr:PIN domain-containing protein [Dokdonella sp.]HNR91555.1 PIN domain-containing protein [Dokdonella sp.]
MYAASKRFVPDANMVVAAFRRRGGTCTLLLRWGDRGGVTPQCSAALFLEHEAVLSREAIRPATGRSLDDVAAVMRAFAAVAEGIDISFRTRPMLSEAVDEMVLEAASNGRVDAAMTHKVKDFRPALGLGVAIVTPRTILGRLIR